MPHDGRQETFAGYTDLILEKRDEHYGSMKCCGVVCAWPWSGSRPPSQRRFP